MENFIKEIIAIDEKARNITAKAESDLNGLGKAVDAKRSEILKQIDETCKKEFFDIREEQETALKRAMYEMDLACEKALNSIEADFSNNCTKWEEEIIYSIAGVNLKDSQGAF